jgi:hypothetical protein
MERPPAWRQLVARMLLTSLVVLAIVGGLEAATRCVLAPASNDFRSFFTYPGKAAALDASPGLRIAVVGNSTARSGVDGDELGKLMTTALDRPVTASLFVADSAEVTTWHFMLRRFFWRPRLKADMVVLLYYGDGLFDSREPEIGRLAQFFTTPADIPGLFRDYLPRLGQRLEYLASACWMTYAARDRLRERTLKALVPDHALYSRRLNDWQYAHRRPAALSQPSFHKLGRLIAEARANGMRVVVVALPTAPSRQYEVPDALVATVEEAGMTFLDDHFIPALAPDLFPDGLHLADEGKSIYTRLLAAELSQLVSPEPGSRGSDAE